MPAPISILLVDDYEVVRKGVRAFLETQPDFEVIGEAGSGEDAIQLAAQVTPDLALLDMLMPGMDGVETTAQIKMVSPHTQVVILSSTFEEQYCFPAFKAGAISYLSKDIRIEKLAEALRRAARGEATLHPRIAARFMDYVRGEDDGSVFSKLSNREMDVLKMVAGGWTNSQIAGRLDISENTVKGHVANIRSKLQIADRVRLAVYAWEKGIVQRREVEDNPEFFRRHTLKVS